MESAGLYIAYVAVVASAFAHGIASVTEQIGAKREKNATSLNPLLLLKLMKQLPYLGGLLLDVGGYVLSFLALRKLPLFLVQAGVTGSIAVTAVTAKYVLRSNITKKEWTAVGLMIIGLGVLSAVALAGRTPHVGSHFRFVLLYAPLLLTVPAAILSRRHHSERVSVGLAAIGGLAFSGAAIIGRIILVPHPLISILSDPLLWSFILYNILGMLTFSIALQKGSVTSVNATLFSSEMVAPTLIGLIFLGDKAQHGYLPIVIAATALIVFSTVVLA